MNCVCSASAPRTLRSFATRTPCETTAFKISFPSRPNSWRLHNRHASTLTNWKPLCVTLCEHRSRSKAPLQLPYLLCNPRSHVMPLSSSASAASQSLFLKLMAKSPKLRLLLPLRVSNLLSALHHGFIDATEKDATEPEVNVHPSRVEVATLFNPIAMYAIYIVKSTYPPRTTISYPNITATITTSHMTQHQNDDTVIAPDVLPDAISIRRQYFSVVLHSLLNDFQDVSNEFQTVECVKNYINLYGKLVRVKRLPLIMSSSLPSRPFLKNSGAATRTPLMYTRSTKATRILIRSMTFEMHSFSKSSPVCAHGRRMGCTCSFALELAHEGSYARNIHAAFVYRSGCGRCGQFVGGRYGGIS